jgi:hypothetical protein
MERAPFARGRRSRRPSNYLQKSLLRIPRTPLSYRPLGRCPLSYGRGSASANIRNREPKDDLELAGARGSGGVSEARPLGSGIREFPQAGTSRGTGHE